MKRVQVLRTITLVGSLALLEATPAHGQTDDWLAWHGCWQADGAPAGEYLCIVPDGAAGVRMVTLADGAVVAESRVVTDGRARRVQTDGCEGSEVASWSADYQRVFLRSELRCEAGVTRQSSGVFAITGQDSWASVQAVTIDGRTATRTVYYSAVHDDVAPAALRSALRRSALDRGAARMAALQPVDAADVDEAVDRIDAAAVQEWLVATAQPFQLADQLAPPAADEVTRSALDHTGYFTQDRAQATREVVHVVERPVEIVEVIERPVYVTHRHVHEYRYRTCWDPFFSGAVLGLGHGVSLGLGSSHCTRSGYGHYSPWGYDLHGWRFVPVRPIIVAGRPVIRYREPRRTPRILYAPPRDDAARRAAVPRAPTEPRQPPTLRTAQPRTGPGTIRTAEPRTSRTGAPTQVRTSEPRRNAVPSRPPTGTRGRSTVGPPPAPSRTAVPRAAPRERTSEPATTRPATPSRTAVPRAAPRERTSEPATTRAATPSRTAVPRAAPRERTSEPPVTRPAATSRAATPRASAPSRAAPPARTTAPARASSRPAATRAPDAAPRSAAPARVARPRGGEERR